MNSSNITDIVIVGGGTAGWLTAAMLAAQYQVGEHFKITLVESPNVKTIGVGEGTWPSMVATLRRIGIPESQFIRHCDASFKQGSKFISWQHGNKESYYHPFSLPLGYSDINLVDHWLADTSPGPYDAYASVQTEICNAHLAPKQANTPDYASVVNYGYHLDAGKFADLLKQHSVNTLGVTHISDDVIEVISEPEGDISAVVTKHHGNIGGDLFIDCTGFKSLLIGEHYQVPFVSLKQYLFNDRAIAVQVPHDKPDSPIHSATHATAHANGWIWDIALPTRRGIGLVYASDYASKETAETALTDYLADTMPHADLAQLSPREIPLNPGHREHYWHRNCVAIGLSSGFIDPLEATAMVLIELSARFINEHLPANKAHMPQLADKFNAKFSQHWANVLHFIKLHYVLSKRTDSDYWLAHQSPESILDQLAEDLQIWHSRPPWHADITMADEMFPPASYQYVLYGMGFNSQQGLKSRRLAEREQQHRMQLQQQMQQQKENYLRHLPTNRNLLESIRQGS